MPDASPSPDAQPFTPIAELGEFGLIERIGAVLDATQPAAPDLLTGIGDDAAVYRVGAGPDGAPRVHVVTTDALVEGVHFDRTFAPLRYVGWKAIASNVSDVVAMNARPLYATVALGVPGNVSVEHVEALYAGIGEACARYGCAVVGGDTTAAARLVISVTVVGEAAEADVVRRSGAEPGDLLCVTGDLGSAAAGLQVLLAGKDQQLGTDSEAEAGGEPIDLGRFGYVVERQLAPQARLDRLDAWREAGARPKALVDLSDGLAAGVHLLAEAGAVGAVVDAGFLPIHVQTFLAAERFEQRPEIYALYGGEDYELLAAFRPEAVEAMPEGLVAVVGQVEEPETGVVLRNTEGETTPLRDGGYKHY